MYFDRTSLWAWMDLSFRCVTSTFLYLPSWASFRNSTSSGSSSSFSCKTCDRCFHDWSDAAQIGTIGLMLPRLAWCCPDWPDAAQIGLMLPRLVWCCPDWHDWPDAAQIGLMLPRLAWCCPDWRPRWSVFLGAVDMIFHMHFFVVQRWLRKCDLVSYWSYSSPGQSQRAVTMPSLPLVVANASSLFISS